MRKQIGIFVAGCLYYSGLIGVSRWLMQHSGKKLIILNYHRASSGDLRCHMLYLRRHYRMLHLQEALEELFSSSNNTRCDRRTPLVLTFDDGYHDNYTHAFALACELRVPITVFLIPGYVESGACFWWGEKRRLLRHAQVNEIVIEGKTHQLNLSNEQEALGQLIDKRLRYASSVAEREQFLGWVR
ncbi:MAG: polysaccharide deacetylase family protein, partial [Ktedonobacteraceae bacterium]|nr:polysaccharide deacetylase family protein [Ktedonobacteraceae bacterium]